MDQVKSNITPEGEKVIALKSGENPLEHVITEEKKEQKLAADLAKITSYNQSKQAAKPEVKKQPTAADTIAMKAEQTKRQLRIDAAREEREAEERRRQMRESNRIVDRNLQSAADIANELGERTAGPQRFIANLPTPGGIAGIIAILVIFTLAIIPIDSQGTTRLKLLWLTLTGKTHMKYAEAQNTIASTIPPAGGGNPSNGKILAPSFDIKDAISFTNFLYND